MNRIKKLREEKHWSRLRLSVELGVSSSTIYGYEREKSLPRISTLIKLSQIFNTSCDYILGISDIRTIMTGVKCNNDIVILSEFNSLTPMQQAMVKTYVKTLKTTSHN